MKGKTIIFSTKKTINHQLLKDSCKIHIIQKHTENIKIVVIYSLYPNIVPLSQTITLGFPANRTFSAEFAMTYRHENNNGKNQETLIPRLKLSHC